jgi:hypothetical protein
MLSRSVESGIQWRKLEKCVTRATVGAMHEVKGTDALNPRGEQLMFSIRIAAVSTVAVFALAATGTAFATDNHASGGNIPNPNDSVTTTTSPTTPTIGSPAVGLTPVIPLSGASLTSGDDGSGTGVSADDSTSSTTDDTSSSGNFTIAASGEDSNSSTSTSGASDTSGGSLGIGSSMNDSGGDN